MYIRRYFKFTSVIQFTYTHIIWLTLWATIAFLIYTKLGLQWLSIPWLPVSLIGIAVAFFVGFKSNSAYDRLWEARKIWGGIVNDSRSFCIAVKYYLTDQFSNKYDDEELNNLKKKLIHRHIAWIYTLRDQLLISTPWEHVNASKYISRVNISRREKFGLGLFKSDSIEVVHEKNISESEIGRLSKVSNKATHILDFQAENIQNLRKDEVIEDFRHIDLQQILYRFYDHQGKCERIKNYPFPRQYASMSFIFVGIFIALLPFGMMPEFAKLGDSKVWLSIPFTVLVGWVFIMMELVGDYSENPFEGLGNDIPMLSLCRTIEIDLREMMGEEDIPEKIKPINHTVM